MSLQSINPNNQQEGIMKTFLKIVRTVFLLDLLLFPLVFYLFYYILWDRLDYTGQYLGNLAEVLIRFFGCVGIGLWFAARDQLPAVDANSKKRAVLISTAAVLFGAVYLFSDLYIPLYDLFWYGAAQGQYSTPYEHPIRLFFSQSLCDQMTVVSYMCLLVAFQLGRIRFSSKSAAA